MVLNPTVYVKNVTSFYNIKKNGEIPRSRTFLAKILLLAYISLKIGNLGKIDNYDVIVTSYIECLYLFGMYGKRRPVDVLQK